MRIVDVSLGRVAVPLLTPFKTALRTATSCESVVVRLRTSDGATGFGGAPPTAAITGETMDSIEAALRGHLIPAIRGRSLDEGLDELCHLMDRSILGNTSAKAALDIALHDAWATAHGVPLHRALGGGRTEVETDITVSVDEPQIMAAAARSFVERGFAILKLKVGRDGERDLARLKAVREAVGPAVRLRVDANQGWTPREAVRTIRRMEDEGLGVEFVEQPTPARDLDGLAFVTAHVDTPVVADESVHSPADALEILRRHAADWVNIKLMKTGGIRPALAICSLAEAAGVSCMVGCMLEIRSTVAAAVHLAAARRVVGTVDLDSPLLCADDPVVGGPVYRPPVIVLDEKPGLGIETVSGVEFTD